MTNIFIALFLLAQITVPLRYYLGISAADDRFAWRMFSSDSRWRYVTLDDTRITVRESIVSDGEVVDRFVDLPSIATPYWIRRMKQERLDVIEKFLRWRGNQIGAQSISCQIWHPAINHGRAYRKKWLMRFPSGSFEEAEDFH